MWGAVMIASFYGALALLEKGLVSGPDLFAGSIAIICGVIFLDSGLTG